MSDYLQQYLTTLAKEGNARLTLKQQHVLIRKAQRGDADARHQMILSVMLYATKIANKYVSSGVDLEDLISYSIDGISRALEKFETGRGLRFTTYATWWIHQSIRRSLERNAIIRLPSIARRDLAIMSYVQCELVKSGIRPTQAAVSDVLQKEYAWNSNRVARIWRIYLLREDDRIIECGDKERTVLDSECITDDAMIAQIDNLDDVFTSPLLLADAVNKLPDRSRDIIVRRFGLFGQRAQTLQEVGKSLGLTKERIRQLQGRALRQLKQILAIKGDNKPPAVAQRPERPETAGRGFESHRRLIQSDFTGLAPVSQCI